MSRRLDRWLLPPITLVVARANLPAPGTEPVSGWTAPTATIRLAPRLTAHYEYHHNRNALTDVLGAGDAFLALTDSGNLLRFDQATLKLTKEWFGTTAVACLGRGEDGTMLA